MTKKLWIGIIIVVVVIAVIVATQVKKEPKQIKIGAILPLTGDQSPYGEALKKGMDLACEEINNRGRILGKKLVVIYEDDRGDPKTGVSAYRKLATVDKTPMVIGAMFSAVTLAIAPIAEKDKIVLLSPTSSAVDLTYAGDYIFRIYPSDTYDGVFLADFTYNRLKAKSVSIIYLQVASIAAVSDVFKQNFKKLGGKVLSMQGYKEGDTEFRTLLLKAKNEKSDIVFIPGYLKEMATLLKQTKELGIKKQFLSISTFYDPKILELAGNAAEGVLFSSPMFDPKSETPEMKEFVTKYKAKYGNEPDILGGYGYDVVNIAVEALKTTKTVKPNDIKMALYNIKNYPGVTGKTSFDSNGDVIKELKIMQVKDSKFTPFS